MTQNTALILPLASQNQLHDPSPYLPAIRQAVQATSESISIVFHGDYIQKISPTATWQPMQAFLGIVYGAAAQEAARLDRILMDVDVYLQGFTGEKELDDGVEDRLQKASKVFVAGDDNKWVLQGPGRCKRSAKEFISAWFVRLGLRRLIIAFNAYRHLPPFSSSTTFRMISSMRTFPLDFPSRHWEAPLIICMPATKCS